MGFTDLFLRIPSRYDKKFIVAKLEKIKKSNNPTDNQRKSCSVIGHKLLASVLKLINSTFPTCSSTHNRNEFCTSNFILSDH